MDRLRTTRVARRSISLAAAALTGLTGCGQSPDAPVSHSTPTNSRATSVSPRLFPADTASVSPVVYPDDAPRVRLAQAQPIPLADGPALEPEQFQNPAAAAPQSADTKQDSKQPEPASQNPVPPNPPTMGTYQPVAPVQQPPMPAPVSTPAFVPAAAPSMAIPVAAAPAFSEPVRVAAALVRRTAELDAVVRRADTLNHHAFELAEHGAIYSARAEFIQALQTIVDGLDADRTDSRHRQMLAAGLQAIREADDFVRYDAEATTLPDLTSIIAGHKTPVLKDQPADRWTPNNATAQYLGYAQEQLAGAVAEIPAGSAALFGLGKIYTVPQAVHGPNDATHGAKAIALQQAALLVDRRNYPAANELGVLLLQFGRLPEARDAFVHGLSISGQPLLWQNLAAVQRAMGQNALADQAQQQASFAARMNPAAAGAMSRAGDVQWMDPASFARTTPVDYDAKPVPQPAATPPAAQQKSVASGWFGTKS